MTEVQTQLKNHATAHLEKIGTQFSIDAASQYVTIGRPDTEIHNLIEEHHFDSVVVGSHGKHGLHYYWAPPVMASRMAPLAMC